VSGRGREGRRKKEEVGEQRSGCTQKWEREGTHRRAIMERERRLEKENNINGNVEKKKKKRKRIRTAER